MLTCEHGGNNVPVHYRDLFARVRADLRSHRGWDPGAFDLAMWLSDTLDASVVAALDTRLLVDLNRSLDNPTLFSRYTVGLSKPERARIIRDYYLRHRDAVERQIARDMGDSTTIVHVGVHTFTPVLRGKRRTTHIGLLFDPAREREMEFCRLWREELARLRPRWKVAFNKPYRGTDDGLTTTLRAKYGPKRYLGIELEVVQTLATRTGLARRRVHEAIGHSLTRALGLALAGQAETKPPARAGR